MPVVPPQTVATILDPPAISSAIMHVGIKKAHMPKWKMMLMGFLAGTYIAVGGQLMFSILEGVTGGPVKLLSAAGFSIALMLIVLVGAELFTGNCLLFMAVLSKRIFWYEMVIDWVIVYFSNFAGAIFYAAIFYGGNLNGYYDTKVSPVGAIMCTTASKKANLTAWESFFRGIGANYLVCLAVIMAAGSKDTLGKMFACMFPLIAFLTIGLEHSIANMYTFSAATFVNCKNGSEHGWYWLNLLMCTIGNILGALILAVSYWAINIQGTAMEFDQVPTNPNAQGGLFVASGEPETPMVRKAANEPAK